MRGRSFLFSSQEGSFWNFIWGGRSFHFHLRGRSFWNFISGG